MSTIAQQTYKNTQEAYLRFIEPQRLPVKKSKFYDDVKRLNLAAIDKSIALASLLRYVREELNVDPVSGRSIIEDEQRDLSDRQRKAEVDKAESDARKARVAADEAEREIDEKWIYRDDAWAQIAALVGTLRDSLRHHAHVAAAAVIHSAGGDPSRASEVYEQIEAEIFTRAFNEIERGGRIEVMFESSEEEV